MGVFNIDILIMKVLEFLSSIMDANRKQFDITDRLGSFGSYYEQQNFAYQEPPGTEIANSKTTKSIIPQTKNIRSNYNLQDSIKERKNRLILAESNFSPEEYDISPKSAEELIKDPKNWNPIEARTAFINWLPLDKIYQ